MDPDARRGRVAVVALGRLHACGFALTTLDDIARAAKVGEAELQVVFGDKEGLLRELVAPLLATLQEMRATAAAADLLRPEELRSLIGKYLDALVAHRPLVGVILGDPTGATSGAVCLVRDAMIGLRDELARGTGSGLDHRIRAASALGASAKLPRTPYLNCARSAVASC